jgi:hypothetical protein
MPSSIGSHCLSPNLDLSGIEAWLDRHSPQNSSMSLLFLQVERFVRSRLPGLAGFDYQVGKKVEVFEIEMIALGNRCDSRVSISLCCHSGRFFKQYGSTLEERVYFKGPMDAARYVVFASGEARERRNLSRKGARNAERLRQIQRR